MCSSLRHRSWAHNLCEESDWPSSQTFHSSEQRGKGSIWSSPKDDAESRDTEQVGNEATGGKRVKGTPINDMTGMTMFLRNARH